MGRKQFAPISFRARGQKPLRAHLSEERAGSRRSHLAGFSKITKAEQ